MLAKNWPYSNRHYGNGFKSGSMRLGKDALVFTKDKDTMSCGFLSQSYLAGVNADSVYVPILSWNHQRNILILRFPFVPPKCLSHCCPFLMKLWPSLQPLQSEDEQKANLEAITGYSPYKSLFDIFQIFDRIKKTGTIIIIFNLRQEGNKLEFDLDDDET